MIVQIYEVRTPEEAGALARLGVDHIGVLVGNGAFPRELTANRASAVFAALPPGAKRVSLSLSSDPAEIARVVEQTRPDIIHIGAAVELFSVRDTQALKAAFPDVRIMRAIPIIDEASIECANDYRGLSAARQCSPRRYRHLGAAMSRRRRTNFGIVQVKFTFNDNGGGLGDVTNVGFSRAIVRFSRSNTQSSARIYVNRRPIAPRASQAMPQNQNRSTWLRASPGADRPKPRSCIGH
jgi:hypothetical protein